MNLSKKQIIVSMIILSLATLTVQNLIKDIIPSTKGLNVKVEKSNIKIKLNDEILSKPIMESIKLELMKKYCIRHGIVEMRTSKEDEEFYRVQYTRLIMDSISVTEEEIKSNSNNNLYWIAVTKYSEGIEGKLNSLGVDTYLDNKYVISEEEMIERYGFVENKSYIIKENNVIMNLGRLSEKEFEQNTILRIKGQKFNEVSNEALRKEALRNKITIEGEVLDNKQVIDNSTHSITK